MFPGDFLWVALSPAGRAAHWKVLAMPRFLVAVNGSPTSEKALHAAVALAQSHNASLVAVTVLDYPGGPHVPSLTSDQMAQVRARLDELLQSAANCASRGVLLTPILREGRRRGDPSCAEHEQVDMLVLGAGSWHSDGRGLGSTAKQVSHHCPYAVLWSSRPVG